MNYEKPGAGFVSTRRKVVAGILVVLVVALGALALYRVPKSQQSGRVHAQDDVRCATAIKKLDAFRFRIENKRHRCMPCSGTCGTLERKLLDQVVEACRRKL